MTNEGKMFLDAAGEAVVIAEDSARVTIMRPEGNSFVTEWVPASVFKENFRWTGEQLALFDREVAAPAHYTWLGRALANLGFTDVVKVGVWDLLEAAFPGDPLMWNVGKYILRAGRKVAPGETREESMLRDLRKAAAYLERKIASVASQVPDRLTDVPPSSQPDE